MAALKWLLDWAPGNLYGKITIVALLLLISTSLVCRLLVMAVKGCFRGNHEWRYGSAWCSTEYRLRCRWCGKVDENVVAPIDVQQSGTCTRCGGHLTPQDMYSGGSSVNVFLVCDNCGGLG
jgi:hypothetical protein